MLYLLYDDSYDTLDVRLRLWERDRDFALCSYPSLDDLKEISTAGVVELPDGRVAGLWADIYTSGGEDLVRALVGTEETSGHIWAEKTGGTPIEFDRSLWGAGGAMRSDGLVHFLTAFVKKEESGDEILYLVQILTTPQWSNVADERKDLYYGGFGGYTHGNLVANCSPLTNGTIAVATSRIEDEFRDRIFPFLWACDLHGYYREVCFQEPEGTSDGYAYSMTSPWGTKLLKDGRIIAWQTRMETYGEKLYLLLAFLNPNEYVYSGVEATVFTLEESYQPPPPPPCLTHPAEATYAHLEETNDGELVAYYAKGTEILRKQVPATK